MGQHSFSLFYQNSSPLFSTLIVIPSFRDEKLLPHPIGKRLVSLYYKISPSLVRAIDRQPAIKNCSSIIYRSWLTGCEIRLKMEVLKQVFLDIV